MPNETFSDLVEAMIQNIFVGTQPSQFGVDSRFYTGDGRKVIGKDGHGNSYHLGQISSDVEWAKRDMLNNFNGELEKLFPEGFCIYFFEF